MEHERILLDIETQRDFFLRGGSRYRAGAEQVAARIYRLISWAKKQHIPVLSTVLRTRPPAPGSPDTPYCVENTTGERKLYRTLLYSRINLGLRNTTDLPSDMLDRFRQVIVEKRETDIFSHARAERLISELPLTTFVICGAGVAGGIVQAAIGLRSRGFTVILARDAVLALEAQSAAMALLRMEVKGVVFARTSEIVAPRPRRRRRRPFRKTVPARTM